MTLMNFSYLQDSKDTELVLKTSSSIVPIPSKVEGNRRNSSNKEHSIILEAEHSIFVEEPKKLTFVDPDELISEITSDPLVSEHCTSDYINLVRIFIY